MDTDKNLFYFITKIEFFIFAVSGCRSSSMELIKILRKSVYLSETFGLISFKIKESSMTNVFIESKKRLKIAKLNFALFAIFHVLLVVISTEEIKSAKDDVSVKIVRFVNLMAFSGGITVMFLTITTKGKLICKGLNEINDLYFSTCRTRPHQASDRVGSNIVLFLGTIVIYLTTVLPVMLAALYVQRSRFSKVMSYAYYAYSMWLENVFVYQFVTIARFTGEVYAAVTRIPKIQSNTAGLLVELKRSRFGEGIIKNFIEVLINVYKLPLFFWMCWSFTMVLQFVLKVNLRVRVVIWCFFISIRVFVIIYGCTFIKSKAEETAENLQELFFGVKDPRVKEEIEIYSYQLLHRKADFNALGFFNVDFSLFHSMVASLATYIVILMQLKGSQQHEEIYNQTHESSMHSILH